MLVLNLRDFENKKYTAYDRFHGNGPNGEIPTKKEPTRTLGFAVSYNNVNEWTRVYRETTQNGPWTRDLPISSPAA